MCSETKGADQLRSYCKAYLCLVFAYPECWFSHEAAPLLIKEDVPSICAVRNLVP